jgi:DinB family protein
MAERDRLLERLATFPETVGAAARGAAERPAPPGEWTPEQVARHLIAVETDVHQSRFRDLATQDSPSWTWQEPGPWPGDPELDLDGVLARFGALRSETVAGYRALDDAGWARTGRHATFGEVDAEGLLRLAVEHDEEHLAGLR